MVLAPGLLETICSSLQCIPGGKTPGKPDFKETYSITEYVYICTRYLINIYTKYSLCTKPDIYTRYPIYKTGYIC